MIKVKLLLITLVTITVGFGLVSCDRPIPKGSLSEKDFYGDWTCQFRGAKGTVLIRKSVYRVHMQWNDGTTYDSDWHKWTLYYSDTGEQYRIRLSELADPLYCNYMDDGQTERTTAPSATELAKINISTTDNPLADGARLRFLAYTDPSEWWYRKTTTSDGTIKPEDQPPAKAAQENAASE